MRGLNKSVDPPPPFTFGRLLVQFAHVSLMTWQAGQLLFIMFLPQRFWTSVNINVNNAQWQTSLCFIKSQNQDWTMMPWEESERKHLLFTICVDQTTWLTGSDAQEIHLFLTKIDIAESASTLLFSVLLCLWSYCRVLCHFSHLYPEMGA